MTSCTAFILYLLPYLLLFTGKAVVDISCRRGGGSPKQERLFAMKKKTHKRKKQYWDEQNKVARELISHAIGRASLASPSPILFFFHFHEVFGKTLCQIIGVVEPSRIIA